MPELSICIVNWNAKDYLKRCLDSILQNKGSLDIEIWVVDNNSSDGSVEMIKQKFPEINLIKNKVNIGFARANNQAIRKSNSSYILLFNPDTIIVYPNTLEILTNFLNRHNEAAIAGTKILNEDGSIQYECARHFPTPLSEFFVLTTLYKRFPKNRLFGHYLMSYWDHNDAREVDCISGSCMMIKKKVLDKIGLLDEDFFMYGEDVDLCYRIKLAGYKNWYLPKTKIIHFGGKSAEQALNHMSHEARKSMETFFKKHSSRAVVLEYRIAVLIATLPIFIIASVFFIISSQNSKKRWARIFNQSRISFLWALKSK